MIEREAIYLGTPRQFVTAAEVYGWELYGQGIERQTGTRYGVDEELHMGGQWLPSDTREPVLAFVDLRGLGHIMAQQIGDRRTRLVCFCEQDAAWPFVEPWWLDLLAELDRLGCIEGANKDRYALNEIKRREIGERYKNGATIEELAREYAVGETTVSRYLDELGIKKRPPGAQRKNSPG